MDNNPGLISSILADEIAFPEKVTAVHGLLVGHVPDIDRVAIAIYEAERDLLRTYAYSAPDGNPLSYYEATLADSRSLSDIARSRAPRIINDLSVLAGVDRQHTRRIGARGYRSSFTSPIYKGETLFGFIFLNSYKRDVFDKRRERLIEPFIGIISLLLSQDIELCSKLFGAVDAALDISKHRDPETGAHLERMARYARLIAWHHPDHSTMREDFSEELFRLAPMHDVGKIAIPDSILLKPGRLSKTEYETMKTHTVKGREIIDKLLEHLHVRHHPSMPMLRNIVEFHHEKMDGSGYPQGLVGGEIPIEARIVAVADIFDALTSERPYKEKWSNARAFAMLSEYAGSQLDPECVRVFLDRQREIEEIQHLFQDESII